MVAQATQYLDLALQQATGGRRQRARRADHRGMRAVRRAERIVDVGVEALHQLGHEVVTVGLFARIEPEVLEQLHAGGELRQTGPHRGHRILRIRLSLRATEMTGAHHGGTARREPLDGGQRRLDAEIVGDGAGVVRPLHRHVEIGANQDALSRHIAEVFQHRKLCHGLSPSVSRRRAE